VQDLWLLDQGTSEPAKIKQLEYFVSSVTIMTKNKIILSPYTLLVDACCFKMYHHAVHHVGLFWKQNKKVDLLKMEPKPNILQTKPKMP
jgi:hypothetical protein